MNKDFRLDLAVSEPPEAMDTNTRNYLTVTAGYWAFTVTDGAIRMLVVLYFHLLGYSPFEVAMLFLFYEVFGIVTNLVGGWLGARIGLNLTMHIGMGLQVVALAMLTVPDAWLTVAYVMVAQAMSGIAKDLNKMSAKATVKTLVGAGGESRLFKYVAILTGSKNALKGAGFFIGAALLELIGFRGALAVLAGMLLVVLIVTAILLPSGVGRMASKPKFTQVFSNTPAINWLSAARFFLFGARDVWFVVGLPVFLYSVLGWSFTQVGTFMASWVIGYGMVQAAAGAEMGFFERYLTLWVFLCILAGIALGHFFNGAFQAIGAMEVAQVNLPVAVLIWLMIIPMLLKIDLKALKGVRAHLRGVGVTLFVNWGVKPFSMALLAWLFIGWLFRDWLPPSRSTPTSPG
jgi:hypothetical protein